MRQTKSKENPPQKIVVRQMKKFDKDVGILSANLEILPNLIFT